MVVFAKHSGHRHYQRMWTPEIGEYLVCEREPTNSIDRYAAAVVKDYYIAKPLDWLAL